MDPLTLELDPPAASQAEPQAHEASSILVELVGLLHSPHAFSDILIELGEPVMVKSPSGWECLGEQWIPRNDDMQALLEALEPDWQTKIVQGAVNRAIDLERWRLRVNAYRAFGGEKLMLSIRRLPLAAPTLKQTGLPESVRLLIEGASGLLLISGATGSGKFTTLAALLESVNETRAAHVITIEDPIEYRFGRKRSIFSQREVGVDCPSFHDGLRDAMRQRPDLIVIGEIRDRDTAQTALLAAESGHLVIGTLHANSAPGAVHKLFAWFSAQERDAKVLALSTSLVGVINQLLLPTKARDGYALAAELLFNHKQRYSKVLGDLDKLAATLERKEEGDVSQTMADSLVELVGRGLIAKGDAIRAVKAGQAALYDRLKNVAG